MYLKPVIHNAGCHVVKLLQPEHTVAMNLHTSACQKHVVPHQTDSPFKCLQRFSLKKKW